MNHNYAKYTGVLAVMMLLSNLALAQILETDFTGGSLDAGWSFVDPIGDCTPLSFTGTQASIAIPAGQGHDPYDNTYGGNRAPRIVQQIAVPPADYGDFDVYAKLDGVMDAQYKMQGIEAIQDINNYVRCEIYGDATQLNALLDTFDDTGNNTFQGITPITEAALGSTPLYLRLERLGTTFNQYISTDGTTWVLKNTVTHTMNVDSIGVYAANSDATVPGPAAPAFTGLFDYFKNWFITPVQLVSFTGVQQSNGNVRLNWATATETNNFGFEVQKSSGNTKNFATISNSFIPGHGTSIEPHQYQYVDGSASVGNWYYRLKQSDLDGPIHYSDPVHVDVVTGVVDQGKLSPAEFALRQNYPNPFNPSTNIKYDVPKESRVTLEVFNLIGQRVATLVDEVKAAGFYSKSFNASALTSGVYMYKLTAGEISFTRKLVLMK